jgi:hypothetical protein
MNRSIAGVLVLAAACGSSHSHSADGSVDVPAGPPTAVVVAGDYMPGHPGILTTIDVESKVVTQNAAPQGSVGDDPLLRHYGGELFVINRSDGNNVTILDAQTRALVEQLGTGTGSNPQDVAVRADTLFVPTFTGKGVAVVTRGSDMITTIDLSADDPDGKPNCVSAYIVGSDLYVACELLDDTMTSLPPRGPGKVYVVDLSTMQIAHTVTMMNNNPLGLFVQLPSGDLAIPTIDFATNAGCIEKIMTGASPASGGCIATNAQLNGYASGLQVQSLVGVQILWITVNAMYPNANLQAYDLMNDALWGAPLTPSSQEIAAAAPCPDNRIVMTDSTMGASGVRIYASSTDLTPTPLAVGLPTVNANAILCY